MRICIPSNCRYPPGSQSPTEGDPPAALSHRVDGGDLNPILIRQSKEFNSVARAFLQDIFWRLTPESFC